MTDQKDLKPEDLISLMMPEVSLQGKVYRLKTVCRMWNPRP